MRPCTKRNHFAAVPRGLGKAATDAVIAHSGNPCRAVSTAEKYNCAFVCSVYNISDISDTSIFS